MLSATTSTALLPAVIIDDITVTWQIRVLQLRSVAWRKSTTAVQSAVIEAV